MKCPNCGKRYFSFLDKCPFCGATTYTSQRYPNRFAAFLDRRLPTEKICLRYLDLFLILFLNLAILSGVGNIITRVAYGLPTLWFHYVWAGVLVAYLLLKLSFVRREYLFRYIRTAVYILLVILNVIQLIANNGVLTIGYATPIAVILLDLSVLLFLCTDHPAKRSFVTTVTCNLFLSFFPVLLLMIPATQGRFPLPAVGFILVAFGLTVLILMNYIFIKMLSFSARVRKRY